MTPTCLKSTNFRATIWETKVASKSTRIMESMVSNLPLTKRSPSSTRELKNETLTGQTPLWSSRMCYRAITKQPGNRCFTSTSQSLLMWQCQYRPRKIAAQKKTSIERSSSSFIKCWMRKSLEIGSISTCSLAETMSSRSRWWDCQLNIFNNLKRGFRWQKFSSQQETCIHPTRHYSLSGSICTFTRRTGQSMSRVADILAMRCSSLSQSTSRTFLICR